MSVADKVLESTKCFDTALPRLMAEGLGGRWVVFRGAEMHGDFATEDEACRSAVAEFGRHGGFAVVQVGPREPTLLSDILHFV